MSINLGTEENPLIAYVAVSGGFVDAIVRAPTVAAFEAAAKAAEMLYEITETITDPDTGETTEQGTGEWAISPGVHFDHLGPVVITPGTYDADGNEVTAPVMDTRHHVNIRLGPPATERVDEQGNLKWHKWALAWTQNGLPDAQINANETAVVYLDVALIDPETISTPSRVWL